VVALADAAVRAGARAVCTGRKKTLEIRFNGAAGGHAPYWPAHLYLL
jgi:hypothetical protein